VEGGGGPLGVVIAPANVHPEGRALSRPGHPGDTKLSAETLDAIVVERPEPSGREPRDLSPDKAFDNPTGREAAASHEYVSHIRRIGEEKLDAKKRKRYPARRWAVERALAWPQKCRAPLRGPRNAARSAVRCFVVVPARGAGQFRFPPRPPRAPFRGR
jgi:hypothetical protein